jgi:hypothetical protein
MIIIPRAKVFFSSPTIEPRPPDAGVLTAVVRGSGQGVLTRGWQPVGGAGSPRLADVPRVPLVPEINGGSLRLSGGLEDSLICDQESQRGANFRHNVRLVKCVECGCKVSQFEGFIPVGLKDTYSLCRGCQVKNGYPV